MGLAPADTWAVSSALRPWRGLQEDVGAGEPCESVPFLCVRPHDGKNEPCNMSDPSADVLLPSWIWLC